MARSRSHALALARLLDDSGAALYALDDQRQLLYVSQPLVDWLGLSADALIPGECNYHSSGERNADAARAALCPPPEVFSGARRTAILRWASEQGAVRSRTVEFIPVPITGELSCAVLAVVGDADLAGDVDLTDGAEQTASSESDRLHELVAAYRREFAADHTLDHLVGPSPAIQRVRSQAHLAASAKTNVLIVGPDGAGKQHLAKAIHFSRGGQRPGTLLPLDCAALDPELLVSSLAAALKPSAVKLQSPATILLNHLDRLPVEAQPELLRLLRAASSQASLTATAGRPLEPLIAEGLIRRDLACLLSTVVIELPRLADRLEDLPALAQAFVEQINASGKKQISGLSPESLDLLATHPWRGNLHELAEIIRRAHAAAQSHLITPVDLPKQIRLAADAAIQPRRPEERIELPAFLAEVERELIERALARSKGNKSRAAHLLGLTRPRLYRRMVQLGLVDPNFKQADE
jgi:DNA-binding NtrC family response regulator